MNGWLRLFRDFRLFRYPSSFRLPGRMELKTAVGNHPRRHTKKHEWFAFLREISCLFVDSYLFEMALKNLTQRYRAVKKN